MIALLMEGIGRGTAYVAALGDVTSGFHVFGDIANASGVEISSDLNAARVFRLCSL